jgi:hypothetical protein
VAANLAQSPLAHRIGLLAGQEPEAAGQSVAELWQVPSEQFTFGAVQGPVGHVVASETQLPSFGHLKGVAVGQPTAFGHGFVVFPHELSGQRVGAHDGQPFEGMTTSEQLFTAGSMHAPLAHFMGIAAGQPVVISIQYCSGLEELAIAHNPLRQR